MVPLDERPCNLKYPEWLFSTNEFNLVTFKELGYKKSPSDFEKLKSFLIRECKDARGLVISIDTLLYGGLVPSRCHKLSKDVLLSRISLLKEIKRENPKLLVYAFQCIMRCANYSSSDEEPDYYEDYGKLIHDAGVAVHKQRLGLVDSAYLSTQMAKIEKKYLDDYISRRVVNRFMNVESIIYLKEAVIDELVIPLDDTSVYGYAAIDQKLVRQKVDEYDMADRVLIYSGADEVELSLLAKMKNFIETKTPKVYIKYMVEKARYLIPLYEGATLSTTLRYHVLSVGGVVVDSVENADIVLLVTAPSEKMEEAQFQPSDNPSYYAERNFPETISFIKNMIKAKKIVAIADNAYANGGDLVLLRLLNKNNLLLSIDAYAGWNTSANTIGTTLAEAVKVFHEGKNKEFNRFLISRYIEDCGYCSIVRAKVANILPKEMTYFNVKDKSGKVSKLVWENLEEFSDHYLSSIREKFRIENVEMPWRRMFEIDLSIDLND